MKLTRKISRVLFSLLLVMTLVFSVFGAAPAEADSMTSTTYHFDDGFDGWTTIDADRDGHDWFFVTDLEAIDPYYEDLDWENIDYSYSGEGALASASYSNGFGALYPNNYLVSPKVELGGSISFYTCPMDDNYYDEVFGVFVSTAGNTDPEDFVEVASWTLTAEHWKQYTCDLSAYSGEGYIAIVHHSSYDVYITMLDEVTITAQVSGHEFTYSADGATITATCAEEECSIPGGTVSFSIVAPEKTAYGDGKNIEATFDGLDAFTEATGIEVSTSDILYSGRGSTSYSTTTEAPSAPGSYTASIIVPGAAIGADSSLEAYVEYTISPAELTITANPIQKNEGEEDPELTYTVDGLLEGDSLTGALERERGEEPGEYDILLGDLSAGENYTINFVGATFTINGTEIPDEPEEPEEPLSPPTNNENDLVLHTIMLVLSFSILAAYVIEDRRYYNK